MLPVGLDTHGQTIRLCVLQTQTNLSQPIIKHLIILMQKHGMPGIPQTDSVNRMIELQADGIGIQGGSIRCGITCLGYALFARCSLSQKVCSGIRRPLQASSRQCTDKPHRGIVSPLTSIIIRIQRRAVTVSKRIIIFALLKAECTNNIPGVMSRAMRKLQTLCIETANTCQHLVLRSIIVDARTDKIDPAANRAATELLRCRSAIDINGIDVKQIQHRQIDNRIAATIEQNAIEINTGLCSGCGTYRYA